MSLRGGARHVEAGGMRLIDSLNPATPVHGVYVVRSITEQCPNASPQDSRGCGAWLVMAKVADMPTTAPSLTPRVIPSPSASPSPSSSPVTGPLAPALTGIIGPGGRPLTSAELDALWAANPSSLVGRIAIVKGPIPLDACPSAASAQPSSGLCVDLAWSVNGYWAVRVEPNGSLTPVGQLPDNNGSPLPLSLVPPVGTKQSNDLVLVDAYLDWMPSLECDMLSYPPDSLCDAGAVTSVLTSAPLATQGMAISYPSFPADDYGVVVAQGAYQIYGSSDLRARPIHGLFLMRGTEILARMVPTGS
jgi:hypothetical protein